MTFPIEKGDGVSQKGTPQDNIIKVGRQGPHRVKKRKGKKMKKMILTLVAMLSMTTAFAEGESANSVNNMAAYELNVNMNKLSAALNLKDDQKEAVADIHHTFASELIFAAQYSNNDRKALVARAIENDVKWMRYVLNEKQMRTYLRLLNSTMNNRGLNM